MELGKRALILLENYNLVISLPCNILQLLFDFGNLEILFAGLLFEELRKFLLLQLHQGALEINPRQENVDLGISPPLINPHLLQKNTLLWMHAARTLGLSHYFFYRKKDYYK